MSRRSFLFLLVFAVLAIAIAIWVQKPGIDTDTGVGQAFFPELEAHINSVDRLELANQESGVFALMKKTDAGWQMENRHGYPLDWAKLRAFLAGLAQARVAEQKTANPDYYSRLGVEDISNPGAPGVLVKFWSGERGYEAIFGNVASGRDAQYARLRDSQASVLLDRSFSIDNSTANWLQRDIIDLPAAEVERVAVRHPGAAAIEFFKTDQDQSDFQLAELPEGRELQSPWMLNGIAGGLASLRLDDVRPAAELDWEDAVSIELLTFDGREVTVRMIRQGDDSWLALAASATAASAGDEPSAEQVAAVATAEVTEVAAGAAAEPGQVQRLQDWARQSNQRVADWAYKIPSYKYDTLAKNWDDLLLPLDGE